MEQELLDIFEQARKLVDEADRRLLELLGQMEAAFDFTSQERSELDPHVDLQDRKPIAELAVRSLGMVFTLEPQANGLWGLTVTEDGSEPQKLGEFRGGIKADAGSRRLAAARVVAAIGNWAQKIQTITKKPVKQIQQQQQQQWQDPTPPPEKHEPTYGAFGKFLGY